MARRRSHGEQTYRVDSKTGLAMARVGAALWLQWKIPARGKNSIQQIFMVPTSAKSHRVQFCRGAKVLLTKGASGKGKEEGQEPGWLLRTWSHVEA